MTAIAEFVARLTVPLYAPGHRPDRFDKARHSGADEIVLDLEDSVGPEVKVAARRNVARWLAAGGSGIVRINGPGSPWYAGDVAMLADRPRAVILPKAGTARQVTDLLAELATGSCVLPILETATGILAARSICAAPGVARVIFGSGDLAREIGVSHANRGALSHARCQVVLAAAAAGLAPPLDGASSAIADLDVLAAEAAHAAGLGFGGKSCIHPRQIPVVRAAFLPSPEEIGWARSVLAVATTGSATAHNGHIVARPLVERARRLLRQHDLATRGVAR